MTKNELKTAIENVAQWAAPEPRDKPLLFAMDSPYLYKDPLGVVRFDFKILTFF